MSSHSISNQTTVERKSKEGQDNPPHTSASHSRFAVRQVLCVPTKPRAPRRPNFESPRNGKRKMRYLDYIKRIHYPEKKYIRTRLSTCEKSFFRCQQPIRFGGNRRFEGRNDGETSRKLRAIILLYASTQNYPWGVGYRTWAPTPWLSRSGL